MWCFHNHNECQFSKYFHIWILKNPHSKKVLTIIQIKVNNIDKSRFSNWVKLISRVTGADVHSPGPLTVFIYHEPIYYVFFKTTFANITRTLMKKWDSMYSMYFISLCAKLSYSEAAQHSFLYQNWSLTQSK